MLESLGDLEENHPQVDILRRDLLVALHVVGERQLAEGSLLVVGAELEVVDRRPDLGLAVRTSQRDVVQVCRRRQLTLRDLRNDQKKTSHQVRNLLQLQAIL